MTYNYKKKSEPHLDLEQEKLLTELLLYSHLTNNLRADKNLVIRREICSLIEITSIIEWRSVIRVATMTEPKKINILKTLLKCRTITKLIIISTLRSLLKQLSLQNKTTQVKIILTSNNLNLSLDSLKYENITNKKDSNIILKHLLLKGIKRVTFELGKCLPAKSLKNFYCCNENKTSRVSPADGLKYILQGKKDSEELLSN